MKQYKTFGDTGVIPDAPVNYGGQIQSPAYTPVQDLFYENDMVPTGAIREFNRSTPYEYQTAYQKSGAIQQERQQYPPQQMMNSPSQQQIQQVLSQGDICAMVMSHLKECKACSCGNRVVKQDRQNITIIIVLLLVIMFLITKLTDYANK